MIGIVSGIFILLTGIAGMVLIACFVWMLIEDIKELK